MIQVLFLLAGRVFLSQADAPVTDSPAGQCDESPNLCGPNCLQLAILLIGGQTTGENVREICGHPDSYHSLEELQEAASRLGYNAVALDWGEKGEPEIAGAGIIPLIIPSARTPDIVPRRHFVLLAGQKGKQVCVIDYPHKPVLVDIDVLRQAWKWNGVVLFVARGNDQIRQIMAHKSRLGHFPSWGYYLTASLVLITALVLFSRQPIHRVHTII